jgi:NAD(P)-dependent dehydrogenase (short-subunit alcohol dehydrogenase family)
VQQAVEAAARGLGGLDGVVNAAGIVTSASLAESDTASWRRMIEVNLVGSYLVCRFAHPWLAQAREATIVNLASGQALLPSAGNSGYAASKGGVVALTRALAAELAPRIRVNAVAPGLVDTPMGRDAMQLDAEDGAQRLAAAVSRYALGRMGTPREIADALLFLSCSESSYITGSTLAVDGGRTFH